MNKARLLANKWICALILFFITNLVKAVGLDGIVVYSYLNEPLSAEIQINELDPNLAGLVTAELGSPQDFMKANIERQTFLNDLNFEVSSVNNKLYIYIYSYENLKNPYLELLLKLKWKDGSLLKSYTLLVDPLPNNINLKSRAHPVSESTALENRDMEDGKKINIKSLMQSTENENILNNISSDNVLVDASKNTDLSAMLSDTSFDKLAEQTNNALEKSTTPITVNFDAEDELEKAQIVQAPAPTIEPKPQDKLLPIKTSEPISVVKVSDVVPVIEVANLNNKYDTNATSVTSPSYTIIPSTEMNTDFPLDVNEVFNNPIQHESNAKPILDKMNIDDVKITPIQYESNEKPILNKINNDDVKITPLEQELQRFENHPQHNPLQQLEAMEYKSHLLNFVFMAILTLFLITLLIIMYRRYKYRNDLDPRHDFNAQQPLHHVNNSNISDENDVDDFEDDFEENSEEDSIEDNTEKAIDRKSIDADIENYQRQLSDGSNQTSYVENKVKSSPLVSVLPNQVIESINNPESTETVNTPSQDVEMRAAIPVIKKIDPSVAFDIAAARAGNSTGMEEPMVNDQESNNMLVEVGNLEHYDLSIYKSDNEQATETHENKDNKDNKVAIDEEHHLEAPTQQALGFPDVHMPEHEEIATQFSAHQQEEETIEQMSSEVEDIKIANDNQPIQTINHYDTNISHNDLDDLDDFDLGFDEHHIEHEGTAAFEHFDEANIKLDLAKQYYSAGYLDSAKEVINEIIDIGNTAQKDLAQELLEKIQGIEK
jgi:FimV-like protein